MLTLIETSEQIALAISRHQRALYNARVLTNPGQGERQGPVEAPGGSEDGAGYAPPPGQGGFGARGMQGGFGGQRSVPGEQMEQQGREDPFADPKDDGERERGNGLQAPLMPMNYGLPPEGVATPAAPTEQAEKPKTRYRF